MTDPTPPSPPFLATAEPEAADQRRSLATIAVSLASLAVASPFAAVSLPAVGSFIPTYESALTTFELLTAVVLLSQFAILRRWSLLVLASAYLLNTVLIVAHALSFPGGFAAAGAFGGPQTTAWLYVFWHIGFPILITVYARIADSPRDPLHDSVSTPRAARGALALVAMLATGLIIAAANSTAWLPALIENGDYRRLVTTGVSPAILLACAIAIGAMWKRRHRTVLDLWLFTVLWVWICDVSLSAVVSSARFHLGWYAGRLFGLIAASVLLVAFLFELDRLYARLVRTVQDAEARNLELIRSRGELVRAQRLEALAELTGGIAHDFNNLLAAIGGNLELIVRRADDSQRVVQLAGNALKTSERGAQMIRRLMSVARKQDLRPETLATREALEEFATLAAGVLRPNDRLRLALDEVGAISVDAAELQAALLNLVTNARDAMPDGGEIVLAAQDVPADPARAVGPCVRISVSDQGSGIAPDVEARIFEPFFTTKSLGLGTGLGLSQVLGFALSAGGRVDVESVPGHGSTFHLVLPTTAMRVSARPPVAPPLPGKAPHSGILLVEDDRDVLAATRDRVEELGYTVVTATSGDEALEMLKNGLPVDLVFSDIVMPGRLNGIQLAVAVRPLRPELKWLLTSGFTGGALERLDLPSDFHFLQKPYSQKDLAEKLVAATAA